MNRCDYCHRVFYADTRFCSKKCADLWRAEWYEKRNRRDIDEVQVEEFIHEANKSNKGETKTGKVAGKVASVAVGGVGKLGTSMLDGLEQDFDGTWGVVVTKGIRLAGKGIGKLIVAGASKGGDAASNAIKNSKERRLAEDYEDEYEDEYDNEYEDEYDNEYEDEYDNEYEDEYDEEYDEDDVLDLAESYPEESEAMDVQQSEEMLQAQEVTSIQQYEEPQAQEPQSQEMDIYAEVQDAPVINSDQKEEYEKLDFSGIKAGLLSNGRKLMKNAKIATSSLSTFAENAKESAKDSADILKESSLKIGENLKGLFKKKD